MKLQIFAYICLLSVAAPALAEQAHCVCDCVYLRTEKIRTPKHFESPSQDCAIIQGRACIGTHRGESYRGTVKNCEAGPREFTNIADILTMGQETRTQLDRQLVSSLASQATLPK